MASILVVESDEHVRKLLRTVLDEAGHFVKVAGSAVEAVELCHQSECFDIVISAVGLPGTDGHALAGLIAGICPSTRMILMSGLGERCHACPYVGGCDFIPKPFELNRLADSLSAAMSRPATTRKDS